MADEVAPSPAAGANAGGKKQRIVSVVIVAGLMLLEGVGVYSFVKYTGASPVPAQAAQSTNPDAAGGDVPPATGEAEVTVVEARPTNRTTGRLITFQLRVSVLVAREHQDKVKKLVEERKDRLLDRVNVTVRRAELKHLNEPGLDTIKRQLKYEFEQILGEPGLVRDVLIPEILQSGPGV
ncbi:MAG TPA: hypothetical protein PKK06_04425 [Phycisphaerae bacterium]|nr:hypothetical protein [Phycisphaerae bacterium]HNU46165.1 hypothetical protein [Phycisphaerae bacterium]